MKKSKKILFGSLLGLGVAAIATVPAVVLTSCSNGGVEFDSNKPIKVENLKPTVVTQKIKAEEAFKMMNDYLNKNMDEARLAVDILGFNQSNLQGQEQAKLVVQKVGDLKFKVTQEMHSPAISGFPNGYTLYQEEEFVLVPAFKKVDDPNFPNKYEMVVLVQNPKQPEIVNSLFASSKNELIDLLKQNKLDPNNFSFVCLKILDEKTGKKIEEWMAHENPKNEPYIDVSNSSSKQLTTLGMVFEDLDVSALQQPVQ